MSIDYKAYQPKTAAPKRGLWLLLGCLLGIIPSLVLTLDKTWQQRWQDLDAQEVWHKIIAFKQNPTSNATTSQDKPETLPEPQFEFYNVLPEMEVAVPGTANTEATAQEATPTDQPASPENIAQPSDSLIPMAPVYILQVGAFKSQPEAERFKAQLALNGFNAGIETSTMPTGAVWYRVKLGPYQDETAIDQDKSRLQAQGMQSFKVKIER